MAPPEQPSGGLPISAFIIVLSLALTACRAPAVDTSRPDPRGGLDVKEAPMLSDLVRAGKLPPLAQRIPSDPLVVTPYERPGEYGGTWRTIVNGPDLFVYKIMGGYAPLVRWKADTSGLQPGTATHWEFDETGSVLTIHLRKGVRWSDGVEFTSADIGYWAGLIKEKQQLLAPPFWSLVDGKEMTVETPDPYTVVMRFAGPNRFVPMHLATGIAGGIDWSDDYTPPKHYLEQFDPRLHPELKDFVLFDKKNRSHENPDRPTLWPWKLTRIEGGGEQFVFERNPYYYMVDTLGRQLPYVDRVVATQVPDRELRVLKILAGEVDAQFRLIPLGDYSLFQEGRKHGGYRVLRWSEASGANRAVLLNWSDPDPVLRELIRDLRFRKALSLAIDREKCNLVAWRGLGVPQQATISRAAWHFRDEEGKKVFDAWAASFAEFDLPRAGAFLDELGLTARDAGGFRLRPDGKRLSLLIDLGRPGPDTDEAEIIADGWRKLGIEVLLHPWPDGMWETRQKLGTYTVSMHTEAEMDVFTYPDWVFPVSDTYWHGKVGKWYMTGGKEGEPPTGPMKDLLAIYARIAKEPDIAQAHRLVHEAVRLHTNEGLFAIGTVAELPSLVIAKENFRNIPEGDRVLGPWVVAGPASSFPETFFFTDPKAPAK